MNGRQKNGPEQFELPLFEAAGARRAVTESPRSAVMVPPTPAASSAPSNAAADAAKRRRPPVSSTAPVSASAAPAPRSVAGEGSTSASPSAAATPRTPFRVIQGGGERKHEALASRDAVVRVLIEAGADLLLRRISSERADEIERKVDRILRLFDQVDSTPLLMPVLQRQLDDLEALMKETRNIRSVRR